MFFEKVAQKFAAKATETAIETAKESGKKTLDDFMPLIEIVILGVVFAFEMGQRKKEDISSGKNTPIVINNYIDPGRREH